MVPAELGLDRNQRLKPYIASMQAIANADPYPAQLFNRFTWGMMLVAGETMLVLG